VIVIVSKPPGARSLERIKERVGRVTKPVVACFLGAAVDARGALWDVVRTLDDAASYALRHVGVEPALSDHAAERERLAVERRPRRRQEQRYARGLFAGGSLCYQAQDVFRSSGITVSSNAPLDGMPRLEDPRRSVGHAMIDLGADEFTRGRPHPMIDPRLRRERILREADDPGVAVLLLDVILGYGCAPDPARGLAEGIQQAREASGRRGGELTVVASVTGTDWDPQRADRQARTLLDAGAVVARSGAEAARLAAAMVSA
jgi:hypothetical protein